jgi:hypothetical protein
MTRRQLIWLVLMVVGGGLPLVVLGFWQEFSGGRTPAALAVADQCVAWLHKPRDQRAQDGQATADRCNTYFRVRSDHDADEDEQRWNARLKCGSGAAGAPPCG